VARHQEDCSPEERPCCREGGGRGRAGGAGGEGKREKGHVMSDIMNLLQQYCTVLYVLYSILCSTYYFTFLCGKVLYKTVQ